MSVLASEILDRVRSQLIDDGDTYRWSDAELLRLMSDGQRTIAAIDPTSSSVRATIQLAAGTLQNLPSGGYIILRAIRNMGTSGTTPGRAIRLCSLDEMDAQDPDWHSSTKTSEVRNFMFDPEDEQIFYVYPPSTGYNTILINYSAVPTELTATSDTIGVADIYRTALFDYTMWRAHLKDSEMSSPAIAQTYFQAFQLFMQIQDQGKKAMRPTKDMMTPNTNTKG